MYSFSASLGIRHTRPFLYALSLPEFSSSYTALYPVMLPARYFDRVACYTTVYITSNIPLEQQYPEIQKCKLETWNAFLRRIHTVTEFRKDGLIREVHYESNENP